MAERRMFAKTIVLSDAFLDMPMSARCLYFTLGMLADDDGFVNAPRSIMRQCGSSEDDMRVLISKKFVLEFENGVIVIKHWRINNYLRNDRYSETKYVDEKAKLTIDEKGGYHFSEPIGIPGGIPGGIPNNGIPSIGKDSIGKDNKNTSYSCAERCSTPPENIIARITLVDGTSYEITDKVAEEDAKAYPGVDVKHEYLMMERWGIANPKKRKTRRGIRQFMNTWLDKAQNRSGTGREGNGEINRGYHQPNQRESHTDYGLQPDFVDINARF